jgi:hypothetical protein
MQLPSQTSPPLVRTKWQRLIRSTALRNGLLTGLLVGLSIGLTYGPSIGLSRELIAVLSSGLSIGLSYWFLSGLFQGVASETIEDQQRVVPNQGIHRSAKNGLVLGLVSAVIVGLSFVLSVVLNAILIVGLNAGLNYYMIARLSRMLGSILSGVLIIGLRDGLGVGLSAGLLFGLLRGGWTCLRHYVLRFLLWRTGAMPWNYSRFLDYAAEHILLRKVGGGYMWSDPFLPDPP